MSSSIVRAPWRLFLKVLLLILAVITMTSSMNSASAEPSSDDATTTSLQIPVPTPSETPSVKFVAHEPPLTVATVTLSAPKPSAAATTPRIYVVQANDTLGNIAFPIGMTATELGALNGIQDLNVIQPGTVLKLSGTNPVTVTKITKAPKAQLVKAPKLKHVGALEPAKYKKSQKPSSAPSSKPAKSKPSNRTAKTGRSDSTAVQKVLAFAANQVGKPYVWGATGPSSFDCSGLMLASFRQAGITLPRTAREQYMSGRKVSKSELRPGDQVFSNYGGRTYGHVGVYTGNSRMIVAPSSGQLVKYASVDWKRFVGATRPIAASASVKSTLAPTKTRTISSKPAKITSTKNMTHRQLASAAGISSSDYKYVDSIVTRESGWRHLVPNSQGSSAYGLCQALPGSKMSSAGADWRTNPVTQLKWCNSYAKSRYGSWSKAYKFWNANQWW